MKAYIIFLLLIAAFISCWNDDGGYQESLDNQSKMGMFTLIEGILRPPKNCYSGHAFESISDNNDGTIGLVIKSQGYNFDGTCHTSYLYKKCVQGQVYRKTQNDCKGTGNESNNYGAKLFNEIRYANDYNECGYDHFNGKYWSIAAFGQARYKELIDTLVTEHSFLIGQCLWKTSEIDDFVKCTAIPDNVLVKVKRNTYDLYVLCETYIGTGYK